MNEDKKIPRITDEDLLRIRVLTYASMRKLILNNEDAVREFIAHLVEKNRERQNP